MKSNFVFVLTVVAAIGICGSDSAMAQSSGGSYFGNWFGGGDDSIRLLQNEKIREDLELVDEQVADFQALRDEMYQGMREMWRGMRDLSREERRAKIEEMKTEMSSRREELEKRVESVLLPHQQKRLSQLSMQSQARRQGGTLGFVASDKLAEKLNLSDEQLKQLKEKAEEARKDLEKQITKLRKKAEAKVLSVLTAEQREQYADIMGESFKFEDRNRWSNRGGRDRRERSRNDSNDN